MDGWIAIYDAHDVKLHRRYNTLIIQIRKRVTMKVYKDEDDAIMASVGFFFAFSEMLDDEFYTR